MKPAKGCDGQPIEATLRQWVESIIAYPDTNWSTAALLNGGCITEDLEVAAKEIERLRAWADRYTLPCDVRLPPNTTIRKGAQLKTLITALVVREPIEGEKPHEFRDEQSRRQEGK